MKNKKINETNDKPTISQEPREKSSFGSRMLKIFIALVLIVAVGYFGFTFELREGNCAVVLRFGAPRAELTEADFTSSSPGPSRT